MIKKMGDNMVRMEEEKLLIRAIRRSYVIPEGVRIVIEHIEGCKKAGEDEKLINCVRQANPGTANELQVAIRTALAFIGCKKGCRMDKEDTTGLLIDEHSDMSSYEQSTDSYISQGTGSLFSEHMMTGNQGEMEGGRTIKVGGNNKIANYSPSWPSSLDIGSSEKSLYKGFKMDRSSDEDYVPSEPRGKKMEEIRDTPMNLGGNKTTELTGMGDSKHAVVKEVSATPELAKRKKSRTKPSQKTESIEGTPVGETQISLPSTIPYGGSSINNALLEAIEEIESGQVVPAINDEMDMEDGEEETLESILSDHDRIVKLENALNTVIRKIVKIQDEKDELIERCDDLEERLEKLTKEGITTEVKKDNKKEVPYIPKQILQRNDDKVPMLAAPVRNREWGSSSERSTKPSYAKTAAKANPNGFTEVVRKSGRKEEKKLDEIRKVYVAPERERRLSIRFNRRKSGKQGLPEEISTEMVRTRLNETLKELNIEGYFSKAERTRMGDVHLCLSKTRAADIATAKNAMTECMTTMGLQEFKWMPDTKKVKVYINDVPLMRDGFGGDWKPEDWHGENAFDALSADIERSNPDIFICARPAWVGKLHVMKERNNWKAGLIILCEETDGLKVALGRNSPRLVVGGRNRFCRVWRENGATVICDKCLKVGHGGAECRSNAMCKWCRKDHHTSVHKCPIVDCAAPKGRSCMHCTRMCALCDKTDHYTGYRECQVLINARSTPPRYGKATPVDKDECAVDGITDNSRIRMSRAENRLRNTPTGEQASDNKQKGDNMTRPSNKPRSSSTPPPNSSNKENETPSEW